MNRLIAAWQKHEHRLKYDGPDSITFGDRKIVLEEEKDMPIQKHMPQQHFDNVIRMIHCSSRERILSIRHATYNTLRRLKVRRNKALAVTAIPAGSDQHDVMSLFVWMNKVNREDKEAVEQILTMDATAVLRTS